MDNSSRSINQLVQILSKTPAFSEKGAERFIEWWWKKPKEDRKKFLEEWTDFTDFGFCSRCFYFANEELCHFCRDADRDKEIICLTVSPFTVDIIEKSSDFKGNYFVLGEEVSGHHNVKKIKSIQARLENLKKSIKEDSVRELILATDFTSSGEATAQLVKEIILPLFPTLKISRLGRGFHGGDMISYGDPLTIKKALERRE